MQSNLFNWFPVTKGLHQLVPQDVYEEAEQYAKVREREREGWRSICLPLRMP